MVVSLVSESVLGWTPGLQPLQTCYWLIEELSYFCCRHRRHWFIGNKLHYVAWCILCRLGVDNPWLGVPSRIVLFWHDISAKYWHLISMAYMMDSGSIINAVWGYQLAHAASPNCVLDTKNGCHAVATYSSAKLCTCYRVWWPCCWLMRLTTILKQRLDSPLSYKVVGPILAPPSILSPALSAWNIGNPDLLWSSRMGALAMRPLSSSLYLVLKWQAFDWLDKSLECMHC